MNPTLILPKGRLYNDIQKFFQLKGFLLPDVWRAGGSSKDVLEKWNLLHQLIVN